MTETANHESCSACNSWWRLPLLLAIVLVAIMLLLRRGEPEPREQPGQATPENIAAAANAATTQLTINFGDDRPQIEAESSWREGMTVADLLNSNPMVNVDIIGSDESAFLTSINGVANEGARGRNWMYRVNGKHADRSFAVYELRPGDHVLWTFADQQ
jgi:hypothetical protein